MLGGASLAGGKATFLGSTVAAILLALIITVLPYLGMSPDDGPMIIGVLVLLGIVLFQLGDIKELVKRNYKRAASRVGSRPPKAAEIPQLYPAGTDFGIAPEGRTLIRGGTVLSLDPAVGDFEHADVLIEGDRILAVGPNLANGSAEVIDASTMIVMPGFVDTHRHIWEGLLRNIGTDVPLEGRSSYISFVLHKLAPAFRPRGRVRRQPRLGARSDRRRHHDPPGLVAHPGLAGAHRRGDPGAEGLGPAGRVRLRVPVVGQVGGAATELVRPRCHGVLLSKDQKLTLALAAPGPEFTDFEVSRDHWKLAREADARITTHVGVGSYGQDAKVQEMGEAGLLGPDTTYIHCTTLNDTEIQMIVDTGGTVSLASPVEMMMGHGMPPIRVPGSGLPLSLSVDVETNVPSDMFNQMRRCSLQRATPARQDKPPMSTRDVLACATIEGAKANGLDAGVRARSRRVSRPTWSCSGPTGST